jgi:hypothetical protein
MAIRILLPFIVLIISLQGCWIPIIVPVGPIVRAIQGPRLCARDYAKVGDRLRTPDGRFATITKIHGTDSGCKSPYLPVLASVSYDEEKQPENKSDSISSDKGTVEETGGASRFNAYDNGTVLDSRTNLMWAAKDNSENINWADAKAYCENYRGGGYSDWRMPTQDELEGLYDSSNSSKATQRNYNVKLTKLIQLSACCPWASETRSSEAAIFNFAYGNRDWYPQSGNDDYRALPVRSAK